MNLRRALRIGSLAFVAALAGANYLPDGCAIKKPVIVNPAPVPVPVSPLEADVVRLNALTPAYALTEKDLVRLARMVYFEDKFDSELHGDEAQKNGFAAVAEVINNRFLYDTCSPESPVHNPTCERDKIQTQYDGDKGLVGVILKEDHGVHQFSSLSAYESFFTPSSLGQGIYDSSFGAQEKHQMDLAYQALIEVLDGSVAPQTQGALSYKNTDVTSKLNGRAISWHDQKAFGDTSLDCKDITHRPAKMKKATDVQCRVEADYNHDWTVKIGGHDFYTVVAERAEFVWADSCKYNDGVYSPKESNKKYCRNP